MKNKILYCFIFTTLLSINLTFGQFDWSENFSYPDPLVGWHVVNNSWPRIQQPDQWDFCATRSKQLAGNPHLPTNPLTETHPVFGFTVPIFSADYAYVGYSPVDYDGATISKWFITPLMTVKNGDVLKFRTRATPVYDLLNAYKLYTLDWAGLDYNRPNRLEVRMNTKYGHSYETDSINVGTKPDEVGDFNILLTTINKELTLEGYPQEWTEYTVVVSGLPPREYFSARIGFRYYVTNGGYDNQRDRLKLPELLTDVVDAASSRAGKPGAALGHVMTAIKLFSQFAFTQIGKNGTSIGLDDIQFISSPDRFLYDETQVYGGPKRVHHANNKSDHHFSEIGYEGSPECNTAYLTLPTERFYYYVNNNSQPITITPTIKPLWGAPSDNVYLEYDLSKTTIAGKDDKGKAGDLPIAVKLKPGIPLGKYEYLFQIKGPNNEILAETQLRVKILAPAPPIAKCVPWTEHYTIPEVTGKLAIDPSTLNHGSTDACGNTGNLRFNLVRHFSSGQAYIDDTLRVCLDNKATHLTLQVTDLKSGNSTSCTTKVDIQSYPPTISDNHVQNYYLAANWSENSMHRDSIIKPNVTAHCPYTMNLISITDQWNKVISPAPERLGLGTYQLYWQAYYNNGGGGTAGKYTTLNVIDTIKPAAFCKPVSNIGYTHMIPGDNTLSGKTEIVGRDIDNLTSSGNWSSDNTEALNPRSHRTSGIARYEMSTPWYNGGAWVKEIPFNCSNAGETFGVTLKVFDKSGNFNTCQSTVKIGNPANPICKNINVELSTFFETPQVHVQPEQILEAGSTQLCGLSNMSISQSVFYCNDINVTTPVQVTYLDANNIERSCVGSVKILPINVDFSNCQDTVVLEVAGADLNQARIFLPATTSSPCGGFMKTQLISTGATTYNKEITGYFQEMFNVGVSNAERTTLINNEPYTCKQTIIVIDNQPPAIIAFPGDTLIQLPGSSGCTYQYEIVNNFHQNGYLYWTYTVSGATDTTATFRRFEYSDEHWLNKMVGLYPGVNHIVLRAFDPVGNMSEISYNVEVQMATVHNPFVFAQEFDNQSVYVGQYCDQNYNFKIKSPMVVPCKQTGYYWYYEVRDSYMGNTLFQGDSIPQDSGAYIPLKVGPLLNQNYPRVVHFGYHHKEFGHRVFTTSQNVRITDQVNTITCPKDTIIYNTNAVTLNYDYALPSPIPNCPGSYWGYNVAGATNSKTENQSISYNSNQTLVLNGTDVSDAYPSLADNSNAIITLNNGVNIIRYSVLETSGNITTPLSSGCSTRITVIDSTGPSMSCPPDAEIHRTSNASCFVNVMESCQQVSGFANTYGLSKIRRPNGNKNVLIDQSDMPNSVSFVSNQMGTSYTDQIIVLKANCNGVITFNWEYKADFPQFFRPFISDINYNHLVYKAGSLGSFSQSNKGVQTGTYSKSIQAGDSIVIGVAEGGGVHGYFKISNLSAPFAALITEIEQPVFIAHPSLVFTSTIKSEYGIGEDSIVYSLRNLNNNSIATCNQKITVIDDFNLDLACEDKTVYLNREGQFILNPHDFITTCFPVSSTSLSIDTVTCSHIGANLITVSSLDQNGNLLTCDFTLTVIDTTPPELFSKFYSLKLNSSNSATLTSQEIESLVMDNCNLSSVTASKTSFNCEDFGRSMLTITAQDVNGNNATLNLILEVIPNGMNANEEDKYYEVCQGENLTISSPTGIVGNPHNYIWQIKEKNHALLPWNYITSDEYTPPVKNATAFKFDRTKTIGMAYNNGIFMAHTLNNDPVIRFKQLDTTNYTWVPSAINDLVRQHHSGGGNGEFFTGHHTNNGNSRYVVHLNHTGNVQVMGYNSVSKSWVVESDILLGDHNQLFFGDGYFFPVRYDGIVRAGRIHNGGSSYVWEIYKPASHATNTYVTNAKNIVGIRNNLNQNMFFELGLNADGHLYNSKDSLTVDPSGNSNLFKLHSFNNQAYIAYKASNGKAAVKKYNGSNAWSAVGTDISENTISDLDLASFNDTLYLVYMESSNQFKVKKFDGENWVSLISPNDNYNLNLSTQPRFIDITGKPQFTVINPLGFGILSLEGWINLPDASMTFNVPTDQSGDNLYRCLSYKFNCASSFSGLKRVVVNEIPNISVFDTLILNPEAVTLSANATSGNVIWTETSFGDNVLKIGKNYITPTLYFDDVFYVHATNGGCNSDTVAAHVFVNHEQIIDHTVSYKNSICKDEGTQIRLDTTLYGYEYSLYEKGGDGKFSLIEGPEFTDRFWISPSKTNEYKIKVERSTRLDAAASTSGGGQFLSSEHFDFGKPELPITDKVSIEAWVYARYGTHPNNILNHVYSNGGIYDEPETKNWEWSNGYFNVHNGNDTRSLQFPGIPSTDQWVHVATTAGPDGMEIYYNGVLVASNTLTASEDINKVNAKLTFGININGSTAESLEGLDEFRIWNTKRTASEIGAAMNSCITGSETGIVLYNSFSNFNPVTKTFHSLIGNNAIIRNQPSTTAPQRSRDGSCNPVHANKMFLKPFTISVLEGQAELTDITDFYTSSSSCGGETVELTATSNFGNIYWYDAEEGGNLVGTGNTLSIFVDKDTVFYAQADSVCGRWSAYVDINGYPEVISAIGDTLCPGSNLAESNISIDLNDDADGYTLWDAPTGGSEIDIYANLEYTQTLYVEAYNDYCSAPRVPLTIAVIEPEITSYKDSTRCEEGSVMLYAAGNGGVVEWWDESENELLHTGNYFQTPHLPETTNYHVYVNAGNGNCFSELQVVTAHINELQVQYDTVLVCGYSYTWINGITYTQSESNLVYQKTNVTGCDSVYYLNLTIVPQASMAVWQSKSSVCIGDSAGFYLPMTQPGFSYTLHDTGDNSIVAGPVVGTGDAINLSTGAINSQKGFELVAELVTGAGTCSDQKGPFIIDVNNSTGDTTATACGSFNWYGIEYTSSATPTRTFQNAAGCDSIVTLYLTINNSNTGDTTATACVSFNWYGTNYTASGSPKRTFQNAAGCDSVVTLNLTINNSNTGDTTAVACNSFNWYGTNYTASGSPTRTFQNEAGCDSVVTLNLTINNSNTGDTTATACGSFNWYGNDYTTSGPKTHILENSNGCDSVVTLNLTINNPTSGSETVIECNSYNWAANGNTYSSSGTYTFMLTGANDCDSTATLHLVITGENDTTFNVTAFNSYTWQGNILTASGIYTDTLSCGAVITLNLTLTFNISGTITYDNSGSHLMNNVKVYLYQQGLLVDSTVTDVNGNYLFASKTNGIYTFVASTEKDWGGVNSTDALLVQNHFAENIALAEPRLTAADVNASNSANTTDALLIKNRFAGKITSFISGDWHFNPQPLEVSNANAIMDFNGICFGDVNGSFTPSSGKVGSLVSLLENQTIYLTSDSPVEIPVSAANAMQVGAISLVLFYPQNMVEVLSVKAVAPGLSNLLINIANGQIRIAWSNLQALSINPNDILLTVTVKALPNTTGEVKFESGNESEFADASGKIITASLDIPTIIMGSTNIATGSTTSIGLNIYPNPFSATSTIIYSLPEAGNVTINLYDITGRMMGTLLSQKQVSGVHSLTLNSDGLAGGIYYCFFTFDNGTSIISERKAISIVR
jgi:hypothetical protein